jgi:NMT1-like family
MAKSGPNILNRLTLPIMETFGLSRAVALAVVSTVTLLLLFAFFWFFYSAPPRTITITSGTVGSSFQTNAVKYRDLLARKGVTLKILPSEGSLQNLQRLNDPSLHVDVGFVQGGITNGPNRLGLVSLGSISYQPLLVFYKGSNSVSLLSDLKGKRLNIGPVGSGTRVLALALLELNGIQSSGTPGFTDLEAADPAQALLDGTVDAVFLMGDSASPQLMGRLLRTPGVQLLNFTQADGYTRRLSYLGKLELPKGSIDFGRDIPPRDVYLVGPTLELLARPKLHPALCDLLIEAAQEVHGGASLMKRKGEFPAPLEHDYPISTEASRYYKSGKSFLYRSLPFGLASVLNRVLVVFVPLVVVLIPSMRAIPVLLRWRVKLRIYRRYRALLAVERELLGPLTQHQREQLIVRLGEIEKAVNAMKVPASFADQFYGLRGDIGFVRERLIHPTGSTVP